MTVILTEFTETTVVTTYVDASAYLCLQRIRDPLGCWLSDVDLATVLLHHNSFDYYNLNPCKKTSQFIIQCKGDISHAFKTAKITVFDPMIMQKSRCALTRRAPVLIVCSKCDMLPTLITTIEGWLVLSSLVHGSNSSCKGSSGLLHIMESNTMIVAVLKA